MDYLHRIRLESLIINQIAVKRISQGFPQSLGEREQVSLSPDGFRHTRCAIPGLKPAWIALGGCLRSPPLTARHGGASSVLRHLVCVLAPSSMDFSRYREGQKNSPFTYRRF